MNVRGPRRLRGRSLLVQVSLGIALAGLLALATNAALASFFLQRHLADRQRTLMIHQAEALASCSARVSVPRLVAKKGLTRILDATLEGTPERRALVIDGQGNLRYASVFPAPLLESLLTQLRQDVSSASRIRGASTVRSFTLGGTIIVDLVSACVGPRYGPAGQSAGILIAESKNVVSAEWDDVVMLELLSGTIGVVLIVIAGVGLGQAIVRPVRKVTAAARAIVAGDLDRRVVPEGPAEARDLAVAFNTMVDEVARRRRLDHDLLANMSHELGAPLGLIQGYAEGLADGVITGDEQRMAALHAITGESERLKLLTGNLLDLALLETGEVQIHLEDVPIDELLTNLAKRFIPATQQQGVTLEIDVPSTLPTVRTDGLQLEQVLVNLLNNALRHTPQHGTITMSARPAAAGLSLAVADTGVGIPAEDLSRIWERFYQVDKGRDRGNDDGGLGLGLAISRSTVQLLGGRIDVESVVDAGTTFRIWLPLNAKSD
jgi:signal transduction histidine kinase